MKNAKAFILFVVSFLSMSTLAIPIKNIIFDLNGVLFEQNTPGIIKKLGLRDLLFYLLKTGGRPSQLKAVLFDVLHKIHPYLDSELSTAPCDEHGRILPKLMLEWLSGLRESEEILNFVQVTVSKHPEWFNGALEQRLIMRLAYIIFDPSHFLSTQRISYDALQTVLAYKKAGYKMYVLSNWDRSSFELLQSRHPAFFSLFDGIIISGNAKTSKPHHSIYHHLLKTYQIQAHECLFIDDQQVNLDTAHTLGMQTLLCPQKRTLIGFRPDLKKIMPATSLPARSIVAST